MAPQRVLVTGASGFLAAHVLNEFLSHGYEVVGTVRSEDAANRVRSTHAKFADKLSFAIVPDVAVAGAFDEAVKGVDGVIHTASPFVTSGVKDNEKELLLPAIQGTKGILASVKAHSPQVVKVIITSSFAALADQSKGKWPEHTYTEADWNPVDYEIAKTTDKGQVAYQASKKFAEKAAWDFVKEEHPHFTISTICPPMIYGPNAQHVNDLSKLNTSSAQIYGLMNGSQKEVPPTSIWGFADVRDVAKAHRLAFETSKANNQRYLIVSSNFSFQQIANIIRRDFPDRQNKVPEGNPGSGLGAEVYRMDNLKARNDLGIDFIPLEETIRDTAREFIKLEEALA